MNPLRLLLLWLCLVAALLIGAYWNGVFAQPFGWEPELELRTWHHHRWWKHHDWHHDAWREHHRRSDCCWNTHNHEHEWRFLHQHGDEHKHWHRGDGERDWR